MERLRRRFTVEYKLMVVKYAEENNGAAAARQFDLDPKQVRGWRKQKSEFEMLLINDANRTRITKRSIRNKSSGNLKKKQIRDRNGNDVLPASAVNINSFDTFNFNDALNTFNSDEHCANCTLLIPTEKITSLKIHDPFMEEKNDIHIMDALAQIFEIKWDPLLKMVREEFSRKQSKHKSSCAKEICQIILCKNCASFLDDVYWAYCSFTKLTHENSIIKLAKLCRQKMNFSPKLLLHPSENDSPNEYSPEEDSSKEDDLFDDFHFGEDTPMSDQDVKQDIKCEPSINVEMDIASNTDTNDQDGSKKLAIKLNKFPCREYHRRSAKRKHKKSIKKKTHREVEKAEKSKYNCSVCGEAFSLKTQLIIHSRNHRDPVKTVERRERPKRGPFPCQKCGKIFKTVDYVRSHERLIHSSSSAKCEKCNKAFKNTATLRYHQSTVHVSQDEREKMKICCEVCGKRMFPPALKLHMVIHTQVKENFNCNKCEKVFSSQERLKFHIDAHYSTNVHTCTDCGKGFPIEQYLNEHIERYHKAKKPFECDECQKRFKTQRLLSRHKVVHSSIKEFVCEECGKACSSQAHLRQHLKCHRDEELGPDAFKCPDCSKCFKNRFCLTAHKIRSHRTDLVAGKRIFTCNICGKSLYDERNLKKHIAAVHNCKQQRKEPHMERNPELDVLHIPIFPMLNDHIPQMHSNLPCI